MLISYSPNQTHSGHLLSGNTPTKKQSLKSVVNNTLSVVAKTHSVIERSGPVVELGYETWLLSHMSTREKSDYARWGNRVTALTISEGIQCYSRKLETNLRKQEEFNSKREEFNIIVRELTSRIEFFKAAGHDYDEDKTKKEMGSLYFILSASLKKVYDPNISNSVFHVSLLHMPTEETHREDFLLRMLELYTSETNEVDLNDVIKKTVQAFRANDSSKSGSVSDRLSPENEAYNQLRCITEHLEAIKNVSENLKLRQIGVLNRLQIGVLNRLTIPIKVAGKIAFAWRSQVEKMSILELESLYDISMLLTIHKGLSRIAVDCIRDKDIEKAKRLFNSIEVEISMDLCITEKEKGDLSIAEFKKLINGTDSDKEIGSLVTLLVGNISQLIQNRYVSFLGYLKGKFSINEVAVARLKREEQKIRKYLIWLTGFNFFYCVFNNMTKMERQRPLSFFVEIKPATVAALSRFLNQIAESKENKNRTAQRALTVLKYTPDAMLLVQAVKQIYYSSIHENSPTNIGSTNAELDRMVQETLQNWDHLRNRARPTDEQVLAALMSLVE